MFADFDVVLLLAARLSGHQVMINGSALCPPLSFVAAFPVGASRTSVAILHLPPSGHEDGGGHHER
jgi:hypothetical protein